MHWCRPIDAAPRFPWTALRAAAALGACALLGAFWPARAHAYEDQQTVGVGLGYAESVGAGGIDHGLILDVSASTGLSAEWALRGRLSYGLHPSPELHHSAIAAAELLYVIDVVEFVPYFGAGLGAVLRTHGSGSDVAPATHVVLGVDYLWSRSMALELDARAHALLTAPENDPLYWGVTLSVVWLLDP